MDQNELKVNVFLLKSFYLFIAYIHFFHNNGHVHGRIKVNPNFARPVLRDYLSYVTLLADSK